MRHSNAMANPVGMQPAGDFVRLMFFVLDDVQRRCELWIDHRESFLHVGHDLLESRLILEVLAIESRLIHKRPHHAGLVRFLVEPAEQRLEGDQLLENGQEPPSGDIPLGPFHIHFHILDGDISQVLVQCHFIFEIPFRLAFLHFEERRLRNVDIASLEQLRHLPEKEREEQGPDMAAVHVGVCHEDDLMVPSLADVERVLVGLFDLFAFTADAGSERHDQGPDLVAREHFVEARLLDVENLALKRQNRLKLAVASLLRGTAGRITLDDIQLAQRRIFLRTVGQLAGKRPPIKRALASDELFSFSRRFTSASRVDRFSDDLSGHRRVLFKIGPKRLVDRGLDDALHLTIAQLGFRLSFELWVSDLDTDDGGEPFTDIVTGERFGVFLE